MELSKLRKRVVSWIAVIGILLAALAPSISLALGAARGETLVEVCTAQGSKWVKVGADSNGSGDSKDSLPTGWNSGHCKLCCSHAPAPGLPPPDAAPLIQLLAFGNELPDAFVAAPRTLPVWLSAQPRAPPL